MKEEKPWCPRCNQGWVSHIYIRDLKVEGWLCDECDAFWFTKELIKMETFIGLSTFLDSHGIKDFIYSYDFMDE
ncbi:MAG: 3'-5' exonuclease [Deltaproteobacteria bacterium]|nr:3'-5' exonuclease [Deltaproteobacteria bacterium]